jgi:hypothetical protein
MEHPTGSDDGLYAVKITPEEAAELAHRVAEFDAALEAIAKAKTRYSAFKRRIAEKYELKSDLFRILNDLSIVMMD